MGDDRYLVDEVELQRIFDERIRGLVFDGVEPIRGHPPVVFLGGQLASGKSQLLEDIVRRHDGNIIPVAPDDFRGFHPLYDEVMRERPHEVARLTGQAMVRWSGMVHEHAHAHGYGMVIEGTFGNPAKPLGIVERLAREPESGAHGGFRAEAVAVAVSEYRSRMDMVTRYLSQPPGRGRWADSAGHDIGYGNIPETMDALEADQRMLRVVVTDRSGTSHYDNRRGVDGEWTEAPRVGDALRDARSEGDVPFGREEAAEWMSAYWRCSEQILERNELNAATAGTMLALHADADLVAGVAYGGDRSALAWHERAQTVQKSVILAGQQGADNAELPRTPGVFFAADVSQRARYVAALSVGATLREAAGAVAASSAESSEHAAHRAQFGMKAPGTTAAKADSARPHDRSVPQSGLER